MHTVSLQKKFTFIKEIFITIELVLFLKKKQEFSI